MAKQTAEEIRNKVTEMMVKAINENTPPWRKPWSVSVAGGVPCNFLNGRRYTGINPLILLFMSIINDYSSKFWGTSASWLKNTGCHVVRDNHATYITLFKMMPKKDSKGVIQKNSKGEDVLFPMLREFPVFNAEQLQAPTVETLLDGRCTSRGGIVKILLGCEDRLARTSITTTAELLLIAKRYLPKKSQPKKSWTREKIAQAIHQGIAANLSKYVAVLADQQNEPDFEPAEEFIKATGVEIKFGGQKASCNWETGIIKSPKKSTFDSMGDYYETVFHEMVHWTQKKDRVGIKEQGEEADQYAFNELVAEIGACFLVMEFQIPMAEEMLEKSKSYVKNWLTKMDSDPKYIFDAATQAGKAVDYLLSFVGRQNPSFFVIEESESEADREAA